MTDLRTAAQQAEPVEEPVAWRSLNEPLNYMTRCADGTIFLNSVIMPEHAVTWAYADPQQAKQQAEPVEPYCYVYEYDGVFGLHREFYPLPYNGMKPSRTVPVYTAPPQRKPLMEGALMGVYIDFDRAADPAWSKAEYLLHFARAVERAHGIGENFLDMAFQCLRSN